jgi:2-methylcitrate dehydratase PrpD
MSIGKQLAGFLLKTRYDDLPPVAVDHARMIIASTLASAASGEDILSASIARDLAKEKGGRPEATVWFDHDGKLPVIETARVNAMLSDAAASDDSDLRNIAHIGTIITSVSLAMAEKTGASGKDVLEAMVTGYEAGGRIGEALTPGLGQRGFHACIITVFGGVLAAAKLLDLTPDQAGEAFALAATSMGGLATSTNSLGREYHAGSSALSALNAVFHSQRGYTADQDGLLEAPRGFLQTFAGPSGEGREDAILGGLGESWDIATDMTIKIWPGATPLSAVVEAAMNAAREGNVDPDAIARIVVSGPRVRGQIGHKHPTDLVGAIHSLPYFVASAVADQEFSWQHATPAKIADPVIGRLQDLVEVDPEPAEDFDHYTWGWGATVTIEMKDGASHRSVVNAPKGSGPRGIDWADVEHKFRTLTPEAGIEPKRADEILDVVHHFEEVPNVDRLIRLL